MIHHIERTVEPKPAPILNGKFIIADHPWCGLGWMIGSAASWLTDAGQPIYVYANNHFYTPRNGADSSNKWDWFFDQKLVNVPYSICKYRSKIFPVNCRKSKETILALRTLIDQSWTIRPEMIDLARTFVPDPIQTLGVHFRGTDKESEVIRPNYEVVTEAIIKEKEKRNLSKVLIATDDENALLALRARLPFKIQWFKRHLRGKTKIGIHQQFGGFRQAKETMTEILAIGMCNHALIGLSSVSDAMLLLANQDQEWTYYKQYHGK